MANVDINVNPGENKTLTFLTKDKYNTENVVFNISSTQATTLSGYGITDAKIASGTITLGSNTITPLTSSSTLDATKLSGTIPSSCYTDTNTWRPIGTGATDAAAGNHTHSTIYTIGDQRSTATTPSSYKSQLTFMGLKNNATIGSPSNTTYNYLVGLKGWSDASGGQAHELAFNDNGIYHRIATSDSAWGSWSKIAKTSDIPSNTNQLANGAGFVTSSDKQFIDAESASVAGGILTVTTRRKCQRMYHLYTATTNNFTQIKFVIQDDACDLDHYLFIYYTGTDSSKIVLSNAVTVSGATNVYYPEDIVEYGINPNRGLEISVIKRGSNAFVSVGGIYRK